MENSARTLEIIERQYADYQSMLALGMEQRRCIAREDLAGVEASLASSHRLIEQLRRYPLKIDAVEREVPQIAARGAALSTLVLEVEALRRQNQVALQQLLERIRKEIRQLDRGKLAAAGYKTVAPNQARLFDGVR